MKITILVFLVLVVVSLQTSHAQFVANSLALPASGGTVLIQPPASVAGNITLTLPNTTGTLALVPSGSAGFIQLGPTATQVLPLGTNLFDIQYSGGTGDALGGIIRSDANGTNVNATGIILRTTATGTGTATGIRISSSGGANRYALDLEEGNLRIHSTEIPDINDMTSRELVTFNTSSEIFERISASELFGSATVLYNTTTTQNTAVAAGNTTNWLFDLAYNGSATGAAAGARIASSSLGATDASSTGLIIDSRSTGTGNALGLDVRAVAQAAGNANGLVISATGGSNPSTLNAIHITGGNLRHDGPTILGANFVGPLVNGNQIFVTTTYLRVILGAAAGVADVVTLNPGVDGQILYMRIQNNGGGGGGNNLNIQSNAVNILTFGNAAEVRLVHLLFVVDTWRVISNVAI